MQGPVTGRGFANDIWGWTDPVTGHEYAAIGGPDRRHRGHRGRPSVEWLGGRIFDTSSVARGALPEVGFFDRYPSNDAPTSEGGTWSNCPYFEQEVVAGSSMDGGCSS